MPFPEGLEESHMHVLHSLACQGFLRYVQRLYLLRSQLYFSILLPLPEDQMQHFLLSSMQVLLQSSVVLYLYRLPLYYLPLPQILNRFAQAALVCAEMLMQE